MLEVTQHTPHVRPAPTNNVLTIHRVLKHEDGGDDDDNPLHAVTDRMRHWAHPLKDHEGDLQIMEGSVGHLTRRRSGSGCP